MALWPELPGMKAALRQLPEPPAWEGTTALPLHFSLNLVVVSALFCFVTMNTTQKT